MRIVEVEWVDSSQQMDRAWYEKSEMTAAAEKGPLTCRSVGYLLHEDARHLSLVNSSTLDGEVGAPLSIPRGCVVAVTELRPR